MFIQNVTIFNGRTGRRYRKRRLGRVICNHLWIDMCSFLNVSTLTKHHSHHFPLLLDFKNCPLTFASQFKFMKMWTLHAGCRSLIENSWQTEFFGSPMQILSRKLKLLKSKLKI